MGNKYVRQVCENGNFESSLRPQDASYVILSYHLKNPNSDFKFVISDLKNSLIESSKEIGLMKLLVPKKMVFINIK